jgi:hypothetical protein
LMQCCIGTTSQLEQTITDLIKSKATNNQIIMIIQMTIIGQLNEYYHLSRRSRKL